MTVSDPSAPSVGEPADHGDVDVAVIVGSPWSGGAPPVLPAGGATRSSTEVLATSVTCAGSNHRAELALEAVLETIGQRARSTA